MVNCYIKFDASFRDFDFLLRFDALINIYSFADYYS